MWGQAVADSGVMLSPRIIPTRVGTRIQLSAKVESTKDHPHACGDKFTSVKVCFADGGSSPRVWGQVNPILIDADFTGIIPTRVGTSCHFYPNHGQGKDHPHACGDKKMEKFVFYRRIGSSPRVWGQAIVARELLNCNRIIPTRVGTRAYRAVFHPVIRDHPHACGDKQFLTDKTGNRRGSSPRVWGQDLFLVNTLGYIGIIPTRVGTRVKLQTLQ